MVFHTKWPTCEDLASSFCLVLTQIRVGGRLNSESGAKVISEGFATPVGFCSGFY